MVMKRIVVSAVLAGALAVASSPVAAGPKKKQGIDTPRHTSALARQGNDASMRRVSSSGHGVGLDGRLEYCAGF
jgi:hypothetical protein